jgi:hypothetical protein
MRRSGKEAKSEREPLKMRVKQRSGHSAKKTELLSEKR